MPTRSSSYFSIDKLHTTSSGSQTHNHDIWIDLHLRPLHGYLTIYLINPNNNNYHTEWKFGWDNVNHTKIYIYKHLLHYFSIELKNALFCFHRNILNIIHINYSTMRNKKTSVQIEKNKFRSENIDVELERVFLSFLITLRKTLV